MGESSAWGRASMLFMVAWGACGAWSRGEHVSGAIGILVLSYKLKTTELEGSKSGITLFVHLGGILLDLI